MAKDTNMQNAEQSNADETNETLNSLTGSLSVLADTATKMAEVAEKGPSMFLMGLGATIILFAMAIKIEVFGVNMSNINTTEFIFLLVTGWLFLGAAFLVKFLQYKDQFNMKKMIWEAGEKQLEKIQNEQNKRAENIKKQTEDLLDENPVNL